MFGKRAYWALAAMAVVTAAACSEVHRRDVATPLTAGNSASFAVPRVAKMTPDGTLAGWGDEGFAINRLAGWDDPAAGAVPASPKVRMGWNSKGLLIYVAVKDVTPHEGALPATLDSADSVEVIASTMSGPRHVFQMVFAPGREEKHPEMRQFIGDYRAVKEPAELTVEAARVITADGYAVEALVPWANLGLQGKVGETTRLQVVVNDADAHGKRTRRFWFPSEISQWWPTDMYAITLAEKAGPALDSAASATYQRFRRMHILVESPAAMAGQGISVSEKGKVLGTGTLAAGEWESRGVVNLPMPANGAGYGPLTVAAGGRSFTTIQLEPPNERARQDALAAVRFAFRPAVFSGNNFPACEFEDPLAVEDIVGPYTLATKYYDADFNEVTAAEKPGRYGAVTTIYAANGKTYTRRTTLFRMKEKPKERRMTLPLSVDLPPEMGIDPSLMHEAVISEQLSGMLMNGAREHDDLAVLLAGLYERTAGEGPVVDRNSPRTRNTNWWFGLREKLGEPRYKYLVQVTSKEPVGSGKKLPLLLYLHGSGERGDDISIISDNGVFKFLKGHPEMEMIAVAPQCPDRESWCSDELMALVKEVEGKYPVDLDRVYVVGLSMGGYGTWAPAAAHPEVFAAAAPVCGIGDIKDLERIKEVPVWSFHGDADPTVPFEPDAKMVAALREAGGRARMTVYPGVGHDSWTATWRDGRLYAWLLEQKRGVPAEPAGGTGGAATMPGE